jgi:anti-sigma regulatory factor (Ser/Thr protein kinase)
VEDTAVGGLDEAAVRGVTFDASAESVARARRLVATQLDAWSLSEISDDARLVASELLTNAALHAQPPIKMRLARLNSGVRLEVSDGSREMPLMVRAGDDVMTGRGWTLVEALSHDWGVTPVSDGKLVWATLLASGSDETALEPVDEAAEPREITESPTGDSADDARYEVSLGDVPTSLLVSAKAHVDALIREFALLAAGAATGTSGVPKELGFLIDRVVGNFAEARQSIKRQALHAAERNDPRTRLSLNLPLAAAEAGLAYLKALDEVDGYCRAERMLTLETPPSHRIFRRWYVEELVAGLRRAAKARGVAAPDPTGETTFDRPAEDFEARLLREYETLSAQQRPASRDSDGG